jgi:hypothetical protein
LSSSRRAKKKWPATEGRRAVQGESRTNGQVAGGQGFRACSPRRQRLSHRAAGGRPVRGRGQCHPRCRAGLNARSARCPQELVTVASAGDQEREECGPAPAENWFSEGVNVWLDLEGAKTSTPHETMIAYCNAWFAEVEGAGFVPGVWASDLDERPPPPEAHRVRDRHLKG